jgi:hypothetical protein
MATIFAQVAAFLVCMTIAITLLVREGTSTAGKMLGGILFLVVVSDAVLILIVALAPVVAGTIQYDPAGFWLIIRVLGFLADLLGIVASLIALCISGLVCLYRPNRMSFGLVTISLFTVLSACLTLSFWISTGAFPRV